MTENTNGTEITKLDGKGALWTIAGTAIGGLATSWLRGLNGGGFGYANGMAGAATSMAGTAVAVELAKKDSEIALLKAENDTDRKLVEVYSNLRVQDKEQDAKIAALKDDIHALDKRIGEVSLMASNGITMLNGAVAQLQHTVAGITKTVVPNTAVCPGWGTVTVTPNGAFPYPPTPAAPATPA